ncbi:MAG: ISL3 family transposase, partial [Cyanobacteria bacterium J06627_15]
MLSAFFQQLLPESAPLEITGYDLDLEHHHLTLTAVSTQQTAYCSLCKTPTHRVHSHYHRTLADLPCVHFSLVIVLEVCKFFCDNGNCSRRIFTERLPQIAAPWARKTVRLGQRLQQIALALGGAAGADLATQMGLSVCGSTVLNHLKVLPLPEFEVPKVLGVDDFAFRKGHNYGTILVDLERHQPIALLPDRKAETLAEWLRQHPGVKVLSRDRSKAYKSGMDDGAPDAIQVADRFHLVYNLSDTLVDFFNDYRKDLKAVEQRQHQQLAESSAAVTVQRQPAATKGSQAKAQPFHQRRVEQQREIKRLRQQNWSQMEIAKAVGVSERTVQRFLALPDLPERLPRHSTFGHSILDPYKPMILKWWNAGTTESKALMRLLRLQGYTGALRTLQRYLRSLRQAQGMLPKRVLPKQGLPKVIDPQLPPLTPRRAAYLLLKRAENRDEDEAERVALLAQQHPNLASAIEIT